VSLYRKYIEVKNIKSKDGLTPSEDKVLIYLLGQAINNRIPVYFAAVPLALIEPYDKNYNPATDPIGQQVINAVIHEWKQNIFKTVWVYPDGDKYILSDDYITYFAALEGKPDFLPCWILGKPDDTRIKDVQGPIDCKEIPSLLGLTK
jgi:hypothetical protein